MKRTLAISLTVFCIALMAGCAPSVSADQIQSTVIAQVTALARQATPYPTYTPQPTYTPAPTIAVKVTVLSQVTRIVEVTPKPSPTPRFTATPTLPPEQVTATARAKATSLRATAEAMVEAEMRLPRGDGFYIVGVDMAPGLWRNDGITDNCYWERATINGDIIDNHFGGGGGTAYLLASDFQFQTEDCGTWTWLGE